MALSDSNVTAIRKLQDRAAARAKVGLDGVPVMTAERLRVACLENDGYETPELNDRLYLHYTGFRRIEGLDAYTGVKALWLECNGLTRIENLHPLVQLRCLYLQNNLIESIGDGLTALVNLVTLDLTGNRLTHLSGLSCLPLLSTLSVGKNALSSAAAIDHLADCAAVTTLDVSDNQLEADGENTVLAVFSRMPRLVTLYLKGNPLVRDTRFYRKTTLTTLPLLRYLDDRPVFEAERLATDAWAAGGQPAEAAARAAYEAEQKAKSKNDTVRFQQWQDEVRQRRAAELEALNAERRSRGDEDLHVLPTRSYVTYGKVSDKAREEHVRMKLLMERAEEVARTTGFHGTAMMDLGREYWGTDASAAAATGEGKEVSGDDDADAGEEMEKGTPTPTVLARNTSVGSVQYVDAATGAPIREADEVDDDAIMDRVRAAPPAASAAAVQPVPVAVPVDVERAQRDAAVQESLRLFNTRNAAAAAAPSSDASSDAARDVWFHELDAALRKFSKQASFDFAKVARALTVAINTKKLPVPPAVAALNGGAAGVAAALTPDACRLRYTHLTAGDAAPATVNTAPAAAASSSDPRVAAVVAAQSAASTSLPAELYGDLGDISQPAHGHAGPGRAIRPVSELLQGEFKLDRFRHYVAAPKNLPSLASHTADNSSADARAANASDDDDDDDAAEIMRPGGHRRAAARPVLQPRAAATSSRIQASRQGDDDADEDDGTDRPLSRDEILRSIHAGQGGPQAIHPDMLGDGRVATSGAAVEDEAAAPLSSAQALPQSAAVPAPVAAAVRPPPAPHTNVDELD